MAEFHDVIELDEDVSANDIANMDDEAFGRMSGLIAPDGKVERVDDESVIEDEPATEVTDGDSRTHASGEKEDLVGGQEETREEEEASRVAKDEQLESEKEDEETKTSFVKEEKDPEEKPDVVEGEKKAEGEEKAEDDKEELPKLLTEFTVQEGEEEKEIPREMTLTFTANKQERKDVPLDKVVLMAQMGFYNEEREQQVLAAKEFVASTRTENEQLRQTIQEVAKRAERLLTDEQFFETAQNEFIRINSPEERAQRAEKELEDLRTSGSTQSDNTQAEADAKNYIASNLAPALEKVVTAYSTVSEDEVMGRFHRLTAPLLVNGIVPISRLGDVEKIINEDMANWAQQIHLERDTKAKAKDLEVKAERTKTTLAKKQVARKTKPTGKGVAPGASKRQKTYASADEWLQNLDGIVAESFE